MSNMAGETWQKPTWKRAASAEALAWMAASATVAPTASDETWQRSWARAASVEANAWRSYHASPRRDRNDGDVEAPRVGSVRVGRGDRLGGGRGRGAVTVPGAARQKSASVCAAPSFFPAPRVRDIPKHIRYCVDES